MRVGPLACLLLTAACAARPSAPLAPLAPSVDIDALIRRGCYRCLESAFAAAAASGADGQAFEAAALLVARSKELGLPPGAWLERALTVLPPGPEWSTYFDIVNTQEVDPLSGDRDALLTESFGRRRPSEVYARWRETLTTGPGSAVFRAYLDLTIACRRDGVGRFLESEARDAASAAAIDQFGDVPLIRYRAGLCGGGQFSELSAARQANPDFVDADLELGRRALQNQIPPDIVEGLARLRSARAAFPDSPVVPIVIGNLHEAREEWPEALAEYEATLALVPTHRDGWLGKTVSLSNLDRYEEALTSATRLLELGSWFIGPAHYWRAWNLYQLARIAEARVEADRAKALMVNAALFVLSGMIEWREQRLESAEEEFQRALAMDADQCEAAFYLASVRWERRLWSESQASFLYAGQCFELSIVTRREQIAALSTTPENAVLNARQIESRQRAIEAAQTRREQAAQNAATLEKVLRP
ncbi:MAG: tetratricopeptide repeat protein [Acidobacteria bacterium]|nr:tetratricopeptide repeat protein [Acidobacteriota bacterium]